MAIPRKTLTKNDLATYLVDTFFKDWTDEKHLTGLELEVIPFKRSPEGLPFIVPLQAKGRAYTLWQDKDPQDPWPGLVEFLKQRQGQCDNMRFEPLDPNTPRFVFDSGAQLTFEPGGQLEYSSVACESIEGVTSSLYSTLHCLESLLAPYDISFFYGALNPWFKSEEVGLQITKERYLSMNRFFNRISPFGQKMMRLTASFQVNLDVGNQQTAQKRWRASNLLSPVFMAMFANSPFHEGRFSGAKSFRAVIWSKLDPSRTGFQDGFLTEEYCPCPAQQYMNFALNAYCMLPEALGQHDPMITFGDWMEHGFNGDYPELNDWVIHLSTLFPEVRPRGFLEMRYMDTLPKAFYSVPGTILRRFLYSETLLDRIIESMEPHRVHLRELLDEAAYRGLESDVLRNLAQTFFEELLRLSPDGDENLMEIAEIFYRNYTHRGINPADEMLARFGDQCPSFDDLQQLAAQRLELVHTPLNRMLAAQDKLPTP